MRVQEAILIFFPVFGRNEEGIGKGSAVGNLKDPRATGGLAVNKGFGDQDGNLMAGVVGNIAFKADQGIILIVSGFDLEEHAALIDEGVHAGSGLRGRGG